MTAVMTPIAGPMMLHCSADDIVIVITKTGSWCCARCAVQGSGASGIDQHLLDHCITDPAASSSAFLLPSKPSGEGAVSCLASSPCTASALRMSAAHIVAPVPIASSSRAWAASALGEAEASVHDIASVRKSANAEVMDARFGMTGLPENVMDQSVTRSASAVLGLYRQHGNMDGGGSGGKPAVFGKALFTKEPHVENRGDTLLVKPVDLQQKELISVDRSEAEKSVFLLHDHRYFTQVNIPSHCTASPGQGEEALTGPPELELEQSLRAELYADSSDLSLLGTMCNYFQQRTHSAKDFCDYSLEHEKGIPNENGRSVCGDASVQLEEEDAGNPPTLSTKHLADNFHENVTPSSRSVILTSLCDSAEEDNLNKSTSKISSLQDKSSSWVDCSESSNQPKTHSSVSSDSTAGSSFQPETQSSVHSDFAASSSLSLQLETHSSVESDSAAGSFPLQLETQTSINSGFSLSPVTSVTPAVNTDCCDNQRPQTFSSRMANLVVPVVDRAGILCLQVQHEDQVVRYPVSIIQDDHVILESAAHCLLSHEPSSLLATDDPGVCLVQQSGDVTASSSETGAASHANVENVAGISSAALQARPAPPDKSSNPRLSVNNIMIAPEESVANGNMCSISSDSPSTTVQYNCVHPTYSLASSVSNTTVESNSVCSTFSVDGSISSVLQSNYSSSTDGISDGTPRSMVERSSSVTRKNTANEIVCFTVESNSPASTNSVTNVVPCSTVESSSSAPTNCTANGDLCSTGGSHSSAPANGIANRVSCSDVKCNSSALTDSIAYEALCSAVENNRRDPTCRTSSGAASSTDCCDPDLVVSKLEKFRQELTTYIGSSTLPSVQQKKLTLQHGTGAAKSNIQQLYVRILQHPQTAVCNNSGDSCCASAYNLAAEPGNTAVNGDYDDGDSCNSSGKPESPARPLVSQQQPVRFVTQRVQPMKVKSKAAFYRTVILKGNDVTAVQSRGLLVRTGQQGLQGERGLVRVDLAGETKAMEEGKQTDADMPYLCSICREKFSSERKLHAHHLESLHLETTQCKSCKVKFHGLLKLNVHVFTAHEVGGAPFCFACGEVCSSIEELTAHFQQHKMRRQQKMQRGTGKVSGKFSHCQMCTEHMLNQHSTIQKHPLHKHTPGSHFKCSSCDDVFVQETKMIEHRRQNHVVQWQCKQCWKKCYSADDLAHHHRTHFTEQRVDKGKTQCLCSLCGKIFVDSDKLRQHLKMHRKKEMNNKRQREFTCEICGVQYAAKVSLQRHVDIVHHGVVEYRFRCIPCNRQFYRSVQLRDHNARHHLGFQPYACNFCDQRFSSGPTRLRHVRQVHTKHKPYVCKHCNESFYEGERLQYHLAKHTRVKSQVCPHCDRAFYMKYALNKHMALHKPYNHMCDICGLTFPRLDQMRVHTKACHRDATVTQRDDG